MYKENNVFDEALERIRFVYDNCDDVIVSMSGGKDSAVMFELAMIVAVERGRLPLKVFWLDQEAEWKATADYMESIMRREDVTPYWYQIPFDFTNSLSNENNFLRVWDEANEDKWIRQKSDISIKVNPSKYNRFHDLVSNLPNYCINENATHCAVLVGIRTSESLRRRMTIGYTKSQFKGITWCQKQNDKTRVFWPVYDFTNDDIWTAIAKNKWKYNKIYDYQYQWGVPKKDMRVSALIHETAWHAIELLQEFEPATYNKFVNRVHGVSTFNHSFEQGILPKELPFAFVDWKEYRDYLLVSLVKPEYHSLFIKRWKGQDTEEWYKFHVKECIINDIDGTINSNAKVSIKLKANTQKGNNKYFNRDKAQFDKYKENKEND